MCFFIIVCGILQASHSEISDLCRSRTDTVAVGIIHRTAIEERCRHTVPMPQRQEALAALCLVIGYAAIERHAQLPGPHSAFGQLPVQAEVRLAGPHFSFSVF